MWIFNCYFFIMWPYFLMTILSSRLLNSYFKSSRGSIVPPAIIVSLLVETIFLSSYPSRQSILKLPSFTYHLIIRICLSMLNLENSRINFKTLLILLIEIWLEGRFWGCSLVECCLVEWCWLGVFWLKKLNFLSTLLMTTYWMIFYILISLRFNYNRHLM